MAEPYLAEIRMFGGNFAPQGWAFCNGQILSIAQNTALFSLLGTTYGGNGTTTFALPDLRGRVAIHQGSGPGLSPYVIGQQAGTESVQLTVAQLPAHAHNVNCDATSTSRATTGFGQSTGSTPTNNFPGLAAVAGEGVYSTGPAASTMNAAMIAPNGGGQGHANIQPYLSLSFIIALQGIYPSRN
jgi:microcystin-dependent protein